jgi:hypothetical protein
VTFVDESARPGPDGLYVVAAVTVPEDVERARLAARKVPPKRRRFHWKGEQQAQRLDMLEVLLELGCGLATYESHPCPTAKHERARAKSIERLVWDLDALSVDHLVIESRGPAADRKDRRAIVLAVKSGIGSERLVYEHRRAVDDCGLWLADALAGASSAALTGQSRYCDRLGPSIERSTIVL